MTDQPPPPGDLVAGTNLEFASSHNRRAVIEAVRRSGTITRAEMARATALAAQTISNIVRELEIAGVLRAAGRRVLGRGQPATLYRINPGGGFSVGLQVDQQSLLGVLCDLAGNEMSQDEAAFPEPTPECVVPTMRQMVERLVDAAGVERERGLGIGVAMPGPFKVRSLTSVGRTALPDWYDYPLAEELGQRLGLPVTLDNDATAAAIGEWLHGAARGLRHFAYLYVGMGLGAGLFLDGQPHRGAGRNAGEIGHLIVQPGGRPCVCGNRGCLERYLSLDAAYEAVGWATPAERSISALQRLFLDGEARVIDWLDRATGHLRHAMNILESLIDPETVVIGGPFPAPMLRYMIRQLDPFHHSVGDRERCDVERLRLGSTGRSTSAQGAAALPIFDEFNPRFETLLKNANTATRHVS